MKPLFYRRARVGFGWVRLDYVPVGFPGWVVLGILGLILILAYFEGPVVLGPSLMFAGILFPTKFVLLFGIAALACGILWPLSVPDSRPDSGLDALESEENESA